ncbi:MAG: hypothetical protein PUB97_09710 [Ruminococcus sp.]|nr:hypothetical protein [Ruminococcus sp.]
MTTNVELFLNSSYNGFTTISKIEKYLEEYRTAAVSQSDEIEWNEVILYAVLAYDTETGRMDSADFMLLRMPYNRYAELCERLSGFCRLFFAGRK